MDRDTYALEATSTGSVPLLGQTVQDLRQEFAWTETPEGDPVVVGRTLAPDPIELSTTLIAVHQQYGFMVLLDRGRGSERIEAFRVDATFIGLDVPDRFAVDSAVSSMHGYAEEVDAWLDR